MDCKNLESVYCYAERVPTTYSPFTNSYIEYATLYVPEVSIDSYKSKSPWKEFGTINVLEDVSGIKKYVEDVGEIILYSIDGKRLEKQRTGVNIIRNSDGTIRKVFKK